MNLNKYSNYTFILTKYSTSLIFSQLNSTYKVYSITYYYLNIAYYLNLMEINLRKDLYMIKSEKVLVTLQVRYSVIWARKCRCIYTPRNGRTTPFNMMNNLRALCPIRLLVLYCIQQSIPSNIRFRMLCGLLWIIDINE